MMQMFKVVRWSVVATGADDDGRCGTLLIARNVISVVRDGTRDGGATLGGSSVGGNHASNQFLRLKVLTAAGCRSACSAEQGGDHTRWKRCLASPHSSRCHAQCQLRHRSNQQRFPTPLPFRLRVLRQLCISSLDERRGPCDECSLSIRRTATLHQHHSHPNSIKRVARRPVADVAQNIGTSTKENIRYADGQSWLDRFCSRTEKKTSRCDA